MEREYKPLSGKTVLVTRSRSQASELREKIETLGGTVMELPVIRQVPPANPEPLHRAVKQIGCYSWILFTSANGVRFFLQKLQEEGLDWADVPAKIGVVGPRTGEMLERTGRMADLTAADFKAEGLLEALKDVLRPGEKILFPRANIARSLLRDELTAMGMAVDDVDAYDTMITEEGIEEASRAFEMRQIDMITFTSSSTVKNFLKIFRSKLKDEWLHGVKIACIGPVTAKTAADLGLKVDTVAEAYTIDGLIEAISKL